MVQGRFVSLFQTQHWFDCFKLYQFLLKRRVQKKKRGAEELSKVVVGKPIDLINLLGFTV